MANNLVKGSGCGTREWREDFVLTDTNQTTSLFKVAQANGNTTIAGTLTVTGAQTLTGVTTTNGIANTGTITSTSDITAGTGATAVVLTAASGNGDFGGNLGVDGTLTVDGASTLTGAVASGALTVTGAATVSTTLGVTGIATLTGATAEGTLSSQVAAVATGTGTSAQILQTYTLPAGQLSANGQGVRIKAWGITASNGNNKTVALTFGATTVCTSSVLAANNKPWYLEALVFRTGATTQISVSSGASQANAAIIPIAVGTPGETLSGTLAITMTGTDGTSSAADITCNGMTVEMLS